MVIQGMEQKQIRVLSMGGGVQTTACLFKYWKEYDYVIFADTGGETPETYQYAIDYLKPFCESKNLPWITVTKMEDDKPITLEQYCLNSGQIPSRNFKWCTDKFKRRPMNKALRDLGATRKNPIIKDIGFSLDESHRMGKNEDPQYVQHNYPLLDDKITRRMCHEIIADAGFPQPPKSACYYCYNANKKEVLSLKVSHPDLFKRMEDMENNAKENFFNVSLSHFSQMNPLDEFFEEEVTCDSGHCFN
jgi:hypothetical protein